MTYLYFLWWCSTISICWCVLIDIRGQSVIKHVNSLNETTSSQFLICLNYYNYLIINIKMWWYWQWFDRIEMLECWFTNAKWTTWWHHSTHIWSNGMIISLLIWFLHGVKCITKKIWFLTHAWRFDIHTKVAFSQNWSIGQKCTVFRNILHNFSSVQWRKRECGCLCLHLRCLCGLIWWRRALVWTKVSKRHTFLV